MATNLPPLVYRRNSEDSDPDPPQSPMPPNVGPDLKDRDVLVKLIQDSYLYLVNRINPRDFFAYLRQENCITLADQEEIKHFVTSIDKASHLIDVVLRKDFRCLEAFLEVLEYNYEDCYVKITGQKPRPKPKEWQTAGVDGSIGRSSLTDLKYLQDITKNLASILKDMNEQKLKVDGLLKNVDDFSQLSTDEVSEERQDNIKLKERIGKLKNENVEISLENKELKHRLQRERSKSKKLSDADVKIVELEKNMREKEAEIQKLQTRHMMQNVLTSMQPNPQIQRLNSEVTRLSEQLQNVHLENKQMREEMDEMERLINRRNAENRDLQERNDSLRTKVEELESTCYWRERIANRERHTVPLSPRIEISKRTITDDEEKEVEPIYDSVPTVVKNFIIDEGDDSNSDASVDSIDPYAITAGASSIMRDKAGTCPIQSKINRLSRKIKSLSVHMKKEPTMFYKQVDLDLRSLVPSKRSGSESKKNTCMKGIEIRPVEIDADLLARQMKVAGGNHSGIFVSDLGERSESGLKLGAELVKVKNVNQSEMSTKCLGDCTLEEATSIIRSLSGRVSLYTWHRQKDSVYRNFLEMRNANQDYSGDLFCIYVAKDPESLPPADSLPISAGDILLVTNTMCENFTWKARKLDPKTGKEMDPIQQGLINSLTQSKTGSIKRPRKKDLMREAVIPPYIYVKPCKVHYKRPVVLCGSDEYVNKVQEALSQDDSFELHTGKEMSQLIPMISDVRDLNKVLVLCNELQLVPRMISSNVYPIVCTVGPSTISKELLKELPQFIIENFEVTEKILSSREEIAKKLTELLQEVQENRLVWRYQERPAVPISL